METFAGFASASVFPPAIGNSISLWPSTLAFAFSGWRKLEAAIQANFYFARPFASWEKGLVENSNRWIRLFIPKGTNISTVPSDIIDRTMQFLNATPRQILGFKTADEVHYARD